MATSRSATGCLLFYEDTLIWSLLQALSKGFVLQLPSLGLARPAPARPSFSNLCQSQSQKAEGIFQCSLASDSPFNNCFPLGEKESSPFFLQCTQALTPAEAQLRNAACASEEPVLQVLALHHRTISISPLFSLL